jgi:CRP-like cAMP-binding protein
LGDEEMMQKSNRIYNCRAKTDVELMVLTKSDFEFYLHQEFPHVYEKILKYAKAKQNHNEGIVKKLLRRIQASAKYHGIPIKNVSFYLR